jgi:hypothetical protein
MADELYMYKDNNPLSAPLWPAVLQEKTIIMTNVVLNSNIINTVLFGDSYMRPDFYYSHINMQK